jgi:hypothetical protein
MTDRSSNLITVHENGKGKSYKMSFNHFESNSNNMVGWVQRSMGTKISKLKDNFMFSIIILLIISNIVTNFYIYNYFTKRVEITEEQQNLFTLRFMTALKNVDNETAYDFIYGSNRSNNDYLARLFNKVKEKISKQKLHYFDYILHLFSSFSVLNFNP